MLVRLTLVLLMTLTMTKIHAEAAAADPIFNIPRLERATIDADETAWGDAGFRVELMPDAEGQIKPASDFDARFRLAWNDAGLLLLVNVRDDQLIEADNAESIWSRDSLEVYYAPTRGAEHYVHAIVSPGVTDRQKAVRTFFNPKISSAIPNSELAITVASKKTADGYVAELLLPWSNLQLTPIAGDEVAFQLMVNDFDAKPRSKVFNAIWFPANDTSRNANSMYRVRLAADASPPAGATATAGYENFDAIHVQVTAGAFAAGKNARITSGDNVVGEALLTLADGRASADFKLTISPLGESCPPLTITLDGQPLKTITLPDANDARMRAYLSQRIVFENLCFGSREFPACAFDDPKLIERLIGPYSIARKFYNSDFASVTSAEQPGRYAAIVEITHGGRTDRRFVTLFHYDEKFKPGSDAVISSPLPAEFNIDSAVIAKHSSDFDRFSGRPMPENLKRDPNLPALLASLHDLSKSSKSLAGQVSEPIREVERRWWMNFKRVYYGFDKLYPNPIQCPVPFDGKPAAMLRQGLPADAGMKDTAAAEIVALCDEWAKQVPEAFNICIARHGVVFVQGGFGKVKGEPATQATRMGTASASKFLAATLMMELVDQGLVKLDDTIEKYVPAVRGIEPARKLTVRDLYLHTTGLPENWGDGDNDIEEFTAAYYSLVKDAPHHYQGTGLALGGKIVELISGEQHSGFYRKHLLDPLKCSDTDCGGTSGGARTTANDLARVAQMMLNGGAYGNLRFLREETVRQMAPLSGRDRIGPDKKIRWGIGTKLYDSDALSPNAMGHPGANGAFIFIDPDRDLIVTMTRTDEGKDYLEHRARLLATINGNINQ